MSRISVNLTEEQAAALKAHARESGVPQAETIRRAIAFALCPDEKTAERVALFHAMTPKQREGFQPVLFTPKQETR
jgi:hypothetical protein